ncbi:MAG: tRNA uridine-5-carboxymethylaminomethyl(34) synthesis GTPase MnmE [Clostridia bacterium]|nr:tRNA uridine-5-carboxymethylaminomethyl(34) synthesis GTPase MnmE [Clostridia bacterium]
MERTIAAIATPHGYGGISVIRISGERAIEIADGIFTGNLLGADSHTVHYGYIKKDDEYIDEVLVTVMKAPRTFTREDVVEISTHGGISVTNRVLDCVISAGACHAEPGEFTKRAFLNGRIDLAKAEAVIDLINSENRMAEQNAVSQLRGTLSEAINVVREGLINLAAHMQVSIDYPDEDLEEITIDDIFNSLDNYRLKVRKLISSADDGRIIKDGIKTVIAGKPNVGKSALMNRIAGYDKAIVTDVAGTTRDVIEENVSFDGVPIRLIDTAGIHDTEDVVEKIGVGKSVRSIEGADLVILLINASELPSGDDLKIIEQTAGKKRIIAANKCDLDVSEEAKKLADILISAETGEGIETLISKIKDMYSLGEIRADRGEIITNMRHKAALVGCDEALSRAIESLNSGLPQDLAAMDINIAIDCLGEITGATVSEDIVAAVFKNFCVGK